MKPHRFASGAEADLAEALEYYRAESEALAGKLYDELQRLIGDVCQARGFTEQWQGRCGGTSASGFLTRCSTLRSPITS